MEDKMIYSNSLDNLSKNVRIYRQKKFPLNLSDNVKCTLCNKLLLDAVQTSCGCRYCRECIDEYTKTGNKKCLVKDCEDIGSIIPDKAINKEISRLKVNCLYDGCKASGFMGNIGAHLDICEYQTIKCEKCQEECIKKEMDDHLLTKCPTRIVKCEHCKKEMKWKDLQEIHLEINSEELCLEFIGNCPYKCEMTGIVNLVSHRKKCKNKPIICPYSEIGCVKQVTQESITQHIIEESFTHSSELMKRIKEQKLTIAKLEKEVSELKEFCSSLRTETNKKLTKYDSKITEIEKLSKSIPSSLNSIRSTEDNTIYKNGSYIWKIENFSSLKQSAENFETISITSKPFYTKEFGYKMSMKIYPAGDGVGKGTHLSVFFTLMRGDFDDLLPWPFKNKVTLTIIDQVNKTTDHSDTFKPDPRSTCYQQPTEDYNIASGSPKFITFHQLSNYIKNDTIYLKIVVLN